MRPAVLALMLAGCGGTTGGGLISFGAAIGGPVDAASGRLEFTTGLGYQVSLTRARLHIGALYLNQTVPTSGAQETACILPGIYSAEVFGPLEVDILSPALQPMPTTGAGIAKEAKAGEVWLTGGDVNSLEDPTVIFDVAGSAARGGASYPFEASLTIGSNRAIAAQNPAEPGANPICKQRIVTLIPVDIVPSNGGRLELRVDARGVFGGVDFATATKVSDAPLLYRFNDTKEGSGALLNGLHLRTGVYGFQWRN